MNRFYKCAFIGMLIAFMSTSASAQELRILCWEGYAPQKYTRQFEQLVKAKYDMDVKVTVTAVSDPQEFFGMIRSQKTDLISPAHNIPKSPRWRFIQGAVVLPINLDNIPNYQHLIPALQHSEYVSYNGKVYGVPIVYGPYGLAYNTNIVKEPPTSWNVLWDKQYAGKYTISSDYHEANIYITALALGLGRGEIDKFNLLQTDEKMQTKLKDLATNARSFWVGVDKADGLQGLALATAWGFSFPELKRRGETWRFAQPKEGTTGWVDNCDLTVA